MRLITFQPKSVIEELNKNGVYKAPLNTELNNKIFCIKVDSNTMERIFMCAPSMPQVAIVFNTDDYDELDSIAWVNKIFLGVETNNTSKYKEYTVDKIDMSSVTEFIDISESDDPDEVQDDFLDKHFKELERLSGHKWYRMCDRADIAGTEEAEELFYYIQLCMMPFKVVKEEDYDKLAELIRSSFIKEKDVYKN